MEEARSWPKKTLTSISTSRAWLIRLAERFIDSHDRQAVEQAVAEARAQLEAEARVTKYLPVLVSRRAVDQLAGRNASG